MTAFAISSLALLALIVAAFVGCHWYSERVLKRRIEIERVKLRHPGFRAALAQAREDAS